MYQSAYDPESLPSANGQNSPAEKAASPSRSIGRASLSPRPPNRAPSPFQITRTTESDDSSPAKAGVKTEDLYDASPNNTFRKLSSEFTFRIDSSHVNSSANAHSSEANDRIDRAGQIDLTDRLKALQLVKETCETTQPDGPAPPTGQAAEEETSHAEHPDLSHSSFLSNTPFRYSANAETRPAEPFYDVEFQSSLKKAQKLARKIRDCLGECNMALEEGSSLHKLRSEAKRLSRFKCPDKRTIGVVGNSGQGKIHPAKIPNRRTS